MLVGLTSLWRLEGEPTAPGALFMAGKVNSVPIGEILLRISDRRPSVREVEEGLSPGCEDTSSMFDTGLVKLLLNSKADSVHVSNPRK
jgi:hypothetical protein